VDGIYYIDPNDYHLETLQDVLSYQSNSYYIKYIDIRNLLNWRRKRNFFSSFPHLELFHKDDEKTASENTIITSDPEVTSTVNSGITATAKKVEEAYRNFMDYATQSSNETHIVTIGLDVRKSLVEAAPYLPLVNKLTTYIVPDLSPSDVVTLSLNVAALTTQAAADYANAETTGDQVIL